GDEPAIEHGRRAGDLGQRGRYEAAGAAFGHRHPAALRGIPLNHNAGERDDVVGKQALAHARRAGQTASFSESANPTSSPIRLPATSGSIGAMTSITRSIRLQLRTAILGEVSCTISASTRGRTASSGRVE